MKEKHSRYIMQIIRQRRLELGYSQEYMAVKMQMGQNCYSKIELGNNKLTVDRLLDICELLKLDATRLLTARLMISKAV